jgi:hypothetical protein
VNPPGEAELNGVMSYNVFSPGRHMAPAFDNGAASETEGPRKRLFGIEVGSVDVAIR